MAVCLFTNVHYYSVYLLFFFLIFAFIPRYSYSYPSLSLTIFSTTPHALISTLIIFIDFSLDLLHPRFPSNGIYHVLLTINSLFLLSSCPNHLNLFSLIRDLLFYVYLLLFLLISYVLHYYIKSVKLINYI